MLDLTPTERRVVTLMARGNTRDETGKVMDISTSTVAKALKRVYAKTGANNTTTAVAILVARGDLLPHEFIDGEAAPMFPMDGKAAGLIHVRILTELDADKLAGLGDAYRCLARAGL